MPKLKYVEDGSLIGVYQFELNLFLFKVSDAGTVLSITSSPLAVNATIVGSVQYKANYFYAIIPVSGFTESYLIRVNRSDLTQVRTLRL